MRFEDIPICELSRPKQWKTLSKKDLSSSGYPVFGANGVIGYTATYTHEDPVLLIGCRGSCGTLHITGPRSYANGNAMAIDQLDDTRVDLQYLYHFLGFRGLKDTITGSSQPQITRQTLSRVKIRVPVNGAGRPDLDEQRRIAAILDKADAIRRNRQEAIQLTEELLRSAFLEMFGDPVANPKGWPTRSLGQLIKLKSGQFLSAKNMRDGPFPVYGGNGVNGFHDGYMFDESMIVIGRVGVYCGAVHRTPPKSWVTDNALYVVTYSDELTPTYLEWALRLANLNQYASQAAQPLLSGGRIHPVVISIPSRESQDRFAGFLQRSRAVLAFCRGAAGEADNLFNALVQRAFRGEL